MKKERLNILFFTPYVPYPLTSGINQRVYNLFKELCRYHDVTIVSLTEQHEADSVYLSAFEQTAKGVFFLPFSHKPWMKFTERLLIKIPNTIMHWFDESVVKELSKIFSEVSPDLIYVEDICLAPYLEEIKPQARVVFDRSRVDLSFQMESKEFREANFLRKIADSEQFSKLLKYEKYLATKYKYQVVCSDDDCNYLHANIDKKLNICIIQNGVDDEYFFPDDKLLRDDKEINLTFSGVMNYQPNVDAMKWFAAEILPKVRKSFPAIKTYCVGKNPTAEIAKIMTQNDVMLTGFVEDMRLWYMNSTIFIAPIRIGGGTRLKIVEAMAMGKPVISTSIGAQGLKFISGKDLFLSDDADEFSENIIMLLNDPELREIIAKQGRQSVLERYTWEKLGKSLSDYFVKIA